VEISRVQAVLRSKEKIGRRLLVIVTNDRNKDYFERYLNGCRVKVIPQGFTNLEPLSNSRVKFPEFTVVYSSPYIDYFGDKHESHPAWGAVHLIDILIPQIRKELPKVRVCLIGRIGKNAQQQLEKFHNVHCMGLLTQLQTAETLRKCHLGIYPRKVDNFRNVQKPYEYLGAGIPTITYELRDTEVVKDLGIGISVASDSEFIDSIRLLSENPREYRRIVENIQRNQSQFSWRNLALELDQEYFREF